MMTDDSAIFIIRMKQERERLGVSRRQLAFAANLGESYISQVERGIFEPTISKASMIARALGLTLASMLEPQDDV